MTTTAAAPALSAGWRLDPGHSPRAALAPVFVVRAVTAAGDEEELDPVYGCPGEAIAAALRLAAARRPGRLARLLGAAGPLPPGTQRVAVCYPTATAGRHGYAELFSIGVRCGGRTVAA